MIGPQRNRHQAAQPDLSVLAGAPAAEVRDLRVTFGSGETAVQAVDEVSATFEVGELTAIMGPPGSGKSTLLLGAENARRNVACGARPRRAPRRAGSGVIR